MGKTSFYRTTVGKAAAATFVVLCVAALTYAGWRHAHPQAASNVAISSPTPTATTTPTSSPSTSPTPTLTPTPSPTATPALVSKAQAEYSNKQYAQAIADYQAALKTVSDNAEQAVIWNQLGNAYRDNGQTDQALNAYQQSITLSPQVVATYINLANLYLAQNNQAQAEATINKGLDANPNNTDLQNTLTIIQLHGVNATR